MTQVLSDHKIVPVEVNHLHIFAIEKMSLWRFVLAGALIGFGFFTVTTWIVLIIYNLIAKLFA